MKRKRQKQTVRVEVELRKIGVFWLAGIHAEGR